VNPIEVIWDTSAQEALLALPGDYSTRVAEAFQRYLDTAEGQVSRVLTNDPRGLRLHVSPYVVRFFVDHEANRLTVGWVYREC
jgi:mRNA-degrading endonuclease RelE of RelBE toxin-antitoxin system